MGQKVHAEASCSLQIRMQLSFENAIEMNNAAKEQNKK